MFDYESLDGLEDFRDVRLEPLPASKDNLFRTAYSVTQTRLYCEGNRIEGVVLLLPNVETQTFRQIHLYQGHVLSAGTKVLERKVQSVIQDTANTVSWFP